MPRKSKGARLYERPRDGIWAIRDTGRREQSTGTRNRREAEEALARYIAERDRPIGPSAPDRFQVAEALRLYGAEHAPTVADPARIAYAIAALVPILGSLPVSSITGQVCRFYQRQRNRAPGTVRKELGTLQAAINYCHAEGYLTAAPRVKLPPKPPARDRWLTRDEAAELVRAAYRDPETKHLARFILIALYTGTRTQAILGLRSMPHTQGGWVDTEAGLMHRRGMGVAETKKRQPPIPIPKPLLAHLRRWEREGQRYVVQFRGQRCGHVKSAWKRALVRSGIAHCTKHDLRHTAITWAMQGGVDRYEASGYFGVGMDTLEKVYAHHHPDHLRGAAEIMGRGGRNLEHVPVSSALKGSQSA